MKKIVLLFAAVLLVAWVGSASAFELSFRNGPTFNVRNWVSTQYKIGLNFASTSKGAAAGFYSSTSIDLSVMKGVTGIWLTPEFQYDIKLPGIPLYIYPKIGIDLLFAWLPGSVKDIGFGIKPAIGAKFDLTENIFIWAEPFGLNIIFAQYSWGPGTGGIPGIAQGGWTKTAAMSYDMMLGVGFRL